MIFCDGGCCVQFLVAETFGLVTFQDDAGAAWSVRVVRRMVSWLGHFCRFSFFLLVLSLKISLLFSSP